MNNPDEEGGGCGCWLANARFKVCKGVVAPFSRAVLTNLAMTTKHTRLIKTLSAIMDIIRGPLIDPPGSADPIKMCS